VVRSLCVIALVAAISGVISHLEHAQAQRHSHLAWVRTVDGWEPSTVLSTQSPAVSDPSLHPFLVAGFQLGASVFVLLAFPYSRPKSR
jgi:hypothetical protein